MGRLHPEFIYSRVIARKCDFNTVRDGPPQAFSAVAGNKTSRWLVSFPSPLGGTNSRGGTDGLRSRRQLRIGGFLVVLGGFLIFASMKAKVAKTESLPPPLPRRVALSHLT